ncbi:MAG: adenine deaminase [Anaerolineales bacterium]|jgi:adenine deaminase
MRDEFSSRRLVDCAMGRLAADLLIHQGQWVSVQSGEIVPGTDVAVLGARIAYVGPDASHCIGPNTQLIEARGRFLVPGLIEGHVHVESGMVTISEFVNAVLPHGTTAMMIDPHEIANVFGLQGVRTMVDEAAVQPIHVWVQMPSCVPSAPGMETPGANIGPAEVAEAMTWPGIIGLGEVMNFPAVVDGDEKIHAEMDAARHAGKVIGGHYPSPDLSLPFHGYAAGGPEDDHEGTRAEDAVARVRQGMRAMLRYGSAWHDVEAQVKVITEQNLDPRHFLLVTDDAHAGTLVGEGHMDRVVRHAVKCGLAPLVALQMATLNAAEHFGVSHEIGQIAPGRYADILLVGDLEAMDVQLVIVGGVRAAEEGKMLLPPSGFRYPSKYRRSVHLIRNLVPEDFAVRSRAKAVTEAHVIGVIENQAPTRHLRLPLRVQEGLVQIRPDGEVAKVGLVERHLRTGRIQVGFVHGFGFNVPCAVASTVAHDCHHLLVVGTDDSQMAMAGNALAKLGGGILVVREGKVRAAVELPIAGLMSEEPAGDVAHKMSAVLEEFRACGCRMANANMQLSLLALVVIPELRISDLGLVDVERFEFVPAVEG